MAYIENNILLENKTVFKKNFKSILIIIFGFAFITRIIIGITYYNEYDTYWYRGWAFGMSNGFFDIYSRAESLSLDYPPLYLFLLYITNIFYRIFGTECHQYIQMFLMKMWPIISDMICGFLIYRIFSKKLGLLMGTAASFLWLFNPSVIFNSSFWGQTDGLMCLLIFVSFWLLENQKPYFASVMFAVAGLTKFQCLFFVPVFLFRLFEKYGVKKFLSGIGFAALTVAVTFIPFMIGSQNPMLFFDVYMGGQGTYTLCSLNAFNLFGLFKLNWVEDSKLIFGLISFRTVSHVITLIIVIFLFILLIFAKRKCIWTISFVFMNTFFMFTTRMHERYQFVTLILILTAAVINKNKGLLYCFAAASIMTFINQAVPMLEWNSGIVWLEQNYDTVLASFSLLNLIVYFVVTFVCVQFLFNDNKTETEMLA